MDFKEALIDKFEKNYWTISNETRAMLLKQTPHQLVAKLAEWMEWQSVKGILKF